MCACAQSLSCVQFFVIRQTLPTRLLCTWDFLGKDNGVGSHSLSPGGLPDPGIESGSPALQVNSSLSECVLYIMYLTTTSNSSMMGYVAQAAIQDLMQNVFFVLGSAQQLSTSSEKWIIAVYSSVLYAGSQN